MSRTKWRRRRAVTTGLATAAMAFGMLATPASAEPAPQSCHGQFVSPLAQSFGGARNAAEAFFGPGPHSVQVGQQFVRAICGTGGGPG